VYIMEALNIYSGVGEQIFDKAGLFGLDKGL
jgi:hypothetical protein